MMNFTTTTKIARQGKKAFDTSYEIVLSNNEPVGMIFGKEYYEIIMESGILDRIKQDYIEDREMRESRTYQEKIAASRASGTISADEVR